MDKFCGSVFWDSTLTWHTETPDFTVCFQKTVLSSIPIGFLWLFSPLDIYLTQSLPSTSSRIPWGPLNLAKLGFSMLLCVLEVVLFLISIQLNPYNYLVDVYVPILRVTTLLLALGLLVYSKQKGVTSSGTQFIYWLLTTLMQAFRFRTVLLQKQQNLDPVSYSLEICYFPICVGQLFLHCWADQHTEYSEITEKSQPSPETRCSFLSKLVFEWYTPITWIGNKRPLEYSDLYSLIPQLTTNQALPKFDRHWRPTSQNPGSVFTTWLKGFGLHYFLSYLLRVIPDFMIFVLPVVLHLLITFVSTPEEPTWHGILYAVILLFNGLFSVIITANAVHLFNYNGLSFNTCLVNNIYRKALRLSATSRRTRSTGEIINHMGVDCSYICGTILTGNIILSTPILVIVALVFLWNILGVAALAGIAAMLLLLPINAWIASRVQKLQKSQMVYKDKRIKLMNEILASIKVLKLYAWEPSFMRDVMKIRSLELAQLRRAQYWNAVANFLAGCAPFFVAFVSFASFVSVSDRVLDAQTAFVALALFNIMSMPMAFLPLLISNTIQASVAIKRVNGYLNAEELEKFSENPGSVEVHVFINNGTFLWDRTGEEILSGININVTQGQLVSIVGVVGSGKSSLLMALLNEMFRKEGNVTVNGTVAYVAQHAWIQNATVRENILFGKPYEPMRYNKVVKACALQPDLEILPGGDNTEIGEKGVNLSGGQKQRIALARAVYHDAEVYLLDDPLSAVDAHVGRHLIDNVIGRNGLLKKKTRILVTHGVVYLPIMDNIYVMDGGKIREEGSYKELMDRQGLFCDFIKEHGGQEERRESVDKSIEQSHSEQKGTNAPQQKKLIEEEKLQTSNVKGSVYLEYIKAAGWMLTTTVFVLYLTFQGFSIGATLWLAYWTDLSANLTANEFQADTIYFLGVYSALGACQAICIFTASLILAVASVRAADRLHYQLLNKIIRAPLQFFDVTPMGRILNRFTKDVSSLDEILPVILKYLINGIFTVIAVTAVISFTTPVFIIVMIPIGILYVFIQRFYIKTSRQVKRIDSASKSPVFSHFSETITGAVTIRAFKAEERFIQELERRQDYSTVPYYASVTANRWLQIRLEMVSSLVVFFAALFAVIGRDSISEGLVGLSISYALQVTVALVTLVRFISEVETNIVAVERMKEYCECPQEAPWEVGKNLDDWPNSGAVEFSSFKARYREGLDLVLPGVDCKIQGGEKIGIVGRTGAGKSSVTLGLFRILEAAGGKIVIDGEDIGGLGLHDIRGKIGIIPQEPVLFDGTLRKNLDPCGEYSDELLWRSLELAHLKNWLLGMEAGLAFDVAEGGENMSVGQRQLVCLARAILKKSKILVLDEATSAVDLETEELILKTIREEFQDSTVLTIAHRLNTIMDSDRVIVLDSGEIKEFDTPKKLLSDSCSLFHGMAKQAGIIKN